MKTIRSFINKLVVRFLVHENYLEHIFLTPQDIFYKQPFLDEGILVRVYYSFPNVGFDVNFATFDEELVKGDGISFVVNLNTSKVNIYYKRQIQEIIISDELTEDLSRLNINNIDPQVLIDLIGSLCLEYIDYFTSVRKYNEVRQNLPREIENFYSNAIKIIDDENLVFVVYAKVTPDDRLLVSGTNFEGVHAVFVFERLENKDSFDNYLSTLKFAKLDEKPLGDKGKYLISYHLDDKSSLFEVFKKDILEYLKSLDYVEAFIKVFCSKNRKYVEIDGKKRMRLN